MIYSELIPKNNIFSESWTKDFILYEETLEKSELFHTKYDPNKTHVMFIFNVPEDYQDVYDLYRAGKYSELPQDYKIQIFKY